MISVDYISPSSYYYWEQCPLRAVFQLQSPRGYSLPDNPDAVLGILIHKLFEKRNEWELHSEERLNYIWDKEIERLNALYKKNTHRCFCYPIQWHSSYYAVKKQLFFKNILRKQDPSDVKHEVYELCIKGEHLKGKIDVVKRHNNIIIEIVDFKTGSIYERRGKQLQIKEEYKKQLALYASIIKEQQEQVPATYLEDIKGKRIKVELSKAYIQQCSQDARRLRGKINQAVADNDVERLAIPSHKNCHYCQYRPECSVFQRTFMNQRIEKAIDLKGLVINTSSDTATIETNVGEFLIKSIKNIEEYKKDLPIIIFNLYFPDEEKRIIYETKYTKFIK